MRFVGVASRHPQSGQFLVLLPDFRITARNLCLHFTQVKLTTGLATLKTPYDLRFDTRRLYRDGATRAQKKTSPELTTLEGDPLVPYLGSIVVIANPTRLNPTWCRSKSSNGMGRISVLMSLPNRLKPKPLEHLTLDHGLRF